MVGNSSVVDGGGSVNLPSGHSVDRVVGVMFDTITISGKAKAEGLGLHRGKE